MVNDTLSDVLTRIRNGCLNNSQVVSIPLTRLSQQVCHTLEKEGFIESVQRDPALNDSLIIKLKYKDLSLGDSFVGDRKGTISSYNLQATKGNAPYPQRDGSQTNQRFVPQRASQQNEKSKVLISKTEDLNKEKPLHSSIKNSLVSTPSVWVKGQTVSQKRPCITNLKRISKPGLRVYARHKQIPTVLGGLGILILSTPKGIMTDREARFRKVGGEILCSIW